MAQSKTTTHKKFKVFCSDGKIREVWKDKKIIIVPRMNMEQFPVLRDAYRAWVENEKEHIVVKTTMPSEERMPFGWHFLKLRWLGKSVIHKENIFGRNFGEAKTRDNDMLKASANKCIVAGIDNETFTPSEDVINQCQEEAMEICRAQLLLKDNASEHYYNMQLERHERYKDAQEFEKAMMAKRASEKDLHTEVVLDTLAETKEEEPKA